MGFCEILTIVFIILKLIGTIDWSWWLVLLPEIITAIVYIFIVIVVCIHNARITRMIVGKKRRYINNAHENNRN